MAEDISLRCRNMRPADSLPHRLRTKDRKHGQLLKSVTEHIVQVYNSCSNEFSYSTGSNPKRTLTWPCEGVHNSGFDNSEHNYICHVGDKVVNESQELGIGKSYEIIENLGQGSFGQVLKCQVDGSPPVALKISKNKLAYFNQGCMEANVLKRLNSTCDTQHIVRMLDCFVFRKHLCIAFELLSMNLFEFLKWNKYRGVAMPTIKTMTKQLLKALQCLRDAALIHCDLKPENVMVCSLDPIRIKLIDFGSACAEFHMMHTYIQSRFYRSPEVLLGLPYSSAIDLWSLGCICAELNLGLPLFTGQCEFDQLRSIAKLFGLPPAEMLCMGSKTKRYFRRVEEAQCKDPDLIDPEQKHEGLSSKAELAEASDTLSTQATSRESSEEQQTVSTSTLSGPESTGQESSKKGVERSKRKVQFVWRLKTSEEYDRDSSKKAVFSKRSWNFTSLADVMANVGEESRSCFLQFLTGLFQINPKCRWTAKQALQHSFVNEDVRFEVDYRPPADDIGPVLGCAPNMSPGLAAVGSTCSAQSIPGNTAPSSTTGTPASSPHGSASSTVMSSARPSGTFVLGYAHVSSPWHLASPMDGSASECRASSQPSGSESWGLGSDTSGSCRGRSTKLSDSDSASAVGSHGSGREETGQRRQRKEPKFWKQMQSMTRNRLESAWSPKGAPSGSSFREAVGMGESGPVIVPVGPQSFATKASGGPEEPYLASEMGSWRSHGKGGRRGRRRRGPPGLGQSG